MSHVMNCQSVIIRHKQRPREVLWQHQDLSRSLQAPLLIIPGTSRILLASIQGDNLGPGALLGQQSIIEGGQRASSLVAAKNNTQASVLLLAALSLHQFHLWTTELCISLAGNFDVT